MRWKPPLAALAFALGAALILPATGVAPSAMLETGTTHTVTVTSNEGMDVVAGLVSTTAEGPLGIELAREPTPAGWIVIAPADADVDGQTLTVTEETPFQDPNGGEWLSREVTTGEATGWAVPIGEVREDPSLDSAYNFAMVVDTGDIPEDADLTASYHETLTLEDGAADPA